MYKTIQETYQSLDWSEYLRIGRIVQSKITKHFGFINNVNVDKIGIDFTIQWENGDRFLIDLEDDSAIILENLTMFDKFIDIRSKKLLETLHNSISDVNDSLILEYKDE